MTYKTTTMNNINNDFKVIWVLNFLISIQLPLKRAQVEECMTKLNKLYILKCVFKDGPIFRADKDIFHEIYHMLFYHFFAKINNLLNKCSRVN